MDDGRVYLNNKLRMGNNRTDNGNGMGMEIKKNIK